MRGLGGLVNFINLAVIVELNIRKYYTSILSKLYIKASSLDLKMGHMPHTKTYLVNDFDSLKKYSTLFGLYKPFTVEVKL